MVIRVYSGEVLLEEGTILGEYRCVVSLVLRLEILDLTLGLYLLFLECFKVGLILDLELGGVSESSESELESGGLIIAVIIVFVTVPKNP